MRGTDWMRIVLCGFVAGVVWFLSVVCLTFLAPDSVSSIQQGAPYAEWGGAFSFGVDVAMGIWAVWLYSAITPRYGAKPTTAALVGVAWWTLKSLQSAKWAGLGFVQPNGVLIGLALASLIAGVVASMVGAGLYDKVDRPAARDPATT